MGVELDNFLNHTHGGGEATLYELQRVEHMIATGI